MEQEREKYKQATLDSEDKVIAAYSTMKSRYNRMVTRIKKLFYAWITEYDISDVVQAQRYWPILQKDIEEELGEELDLRWADVQQLMIDIFTFNYRFALADGGWEGDEEDENNLVPFAILALLSIAWAADGMNLQQRFEKRKKQLLEEVRIILLRQVAIGVPKKQIWDAVLHEINKPKYRGSTQITDEAQRIANEAVRKATERRTDGYTINEILDYRTCPFCRSMDRKHFTWNEYEIGITAPQFHPRCRGRIIPDKKVVK